MVILVKISYNYPHPPSTPSTTYPLSNNNYILQLSKEIQRTPKKETAVPPSTPTKQTAEQRMISRASLSHLSQSAAKQQNPPASLNLWLINTIKLESFAALSGRKSAYSPSVPPSPSLPILQLINMRLNEDTSPAKKFLQNYNTHLSLFSTKINCISYIMHQNSPPQKASKKIKFFFYSFPNIAHFLF